MPSRTPMGMITKHTPGWEIDERNLKSMNLTDFHPKRIENLKRSNILVNIRFFAKTSDIKNFSQNIRSDVKTSEVATLNARTVAIGGKPRFHHSLPFMTKHKPPFGCGPPDRTRNYRIINTNTATTAELALLLKHANSIVFATFVQ